MLRNYLIISLRTLVRQPGYSFINVAGLAIGMAAFALIAVFVQNELGFDDYQENGQDVYRVTLDAKVGDQEAVTSNSPAVMAGAFIDAFPEVVDATRINSYSSEILISLEDRSFYEPGFFQADSSIFSVFTLPLIEGNPRTALNRPNTVVLSRSIAEKYFGDGPALGRVIRWDNRVDYEVTGVMEDVPEKSHFRPELIGSFLTNNQWDSSIWLNNSYFTYILLDEGSRPEDLEAKFPAFQRANVGPQMQQFMGQSYDEAIAAGLRYDWKLERMSDIYLYSRIDDQIGQTGDIRYLYILGVIGVFVLLIACINFVNLSTARATGRAREVGVRKVLGSDRRQLVTQFLGESTVISMVAMALGMVIVLATLPVFRAVAGVDLRLTSWLVAFMMVTALATGLLAGFYPAMVLSRFKPVVVLKGTFSRSRQGTWLRSGLVVFQFAISIVLLVGTAVVYKQLAFIQDRDLGFDQEQVVVLPIETVQGLASFGTFRQNLLGHAAVVDAASAGILPGPERIHNFTGFRGEGGSQDDFLLAGLGEVSDDYVETLGLRLVAGRDFDAGFVSDSSAFVINQAMARQLGWTPEESVGKTIYRLSEDVDRPGKIIGVLEDAHYESVHQSIRPMVLGRRADNQRYGLVRLNRVDPEILGVLQTNWMALEPGYPFRYFFMDDDYSRFYERERRLGSLYSLFTGLAILIACLGLFGLASFIATQRTREIGVRKALGASASSIVVMLSREFTVLVLLACAVGFPVAWFAMNRWLQDFAYATEIGWLTFALSGLAALAVAWVTVAFQAIKAASSDPVRALRYE